MDTSENLRMGFRIPSALAGDDNEVDASAEGLQKVAEMIAGTALGAAILGAGIWMYNQVKTASGADVPNIGDLY